MRNKIVIILILIIPKVLLAQINNRTNKDWVINEIYASNSSSRYGLFVELYNPSSPSDKIPADLFLSTSKKDPYQYRVKSRSHYNPDVRQKGYRTAKLSVVRFKSRTIRIYGQHDTLYLFKRINYSEFQLKDALPVLLNDTLSIGRCGNNICYFNMATPGRVNKNVDPSQYISRKNYRVSVLGGISSAKSSFGNDAGNLPSFGIKVQKIVNRRLFYTATSAALFHQGYSFKSKQTTTTTTGQFTRSVDGYHSAFAFWAGKDIGLFLTPRLDISAGVALVLVSLAHQVYDESRTLIEPDGTIIHDDLKQNEKIGNYQLPVLTFNTGINYQLTSKLKIELFHNVLFRTFEKNETTYYHSFNVGVSMSFRHKGRGYREGLLW